MCVAISPKLRSQLVVCPSRLTKRDEFDVFYVSFHLTNSRPLFAPLTRTKTSKRRPGRTSRGQNFQVARARCKPGSIATSIVQFGFGS